MIEALKAYFLERHTLIYWQFLAFAVGYMAVGFAAGFAVGYVVPNRPDLAIFMGMAGTVSLSVGIWSRKSKKEEPQNAKK